VAICEFSNDLKMSSVGWIPNALQTDGHGLGESLQLLTSLTPDGDPVVTESEADPDHLRSNAV